MMTMVVVVVTVTLVMEVKLVTVVVVMLMMIVLVMMIATVILMIMKVAVMIHPIYSTFISSFTICLYVQNLSCQMFLQEKRREGWRNKIPFQAASSAWMRDKP